MAAASLRRDALLPQPPDGLGRGAALALAAHVGLFVALTSAVDWRSRPPEAAAVAELWAAVPQTAAPRPAPPPPAPAPAPPAPAPAPAPAPTPAPPPPAPAPPPPVRADIAIEAEKQRKAEREVERQRLQREEAAREKLELAREEKAKTAKAAAEKAAADKLAAQKAAAERAAEEKRVAQQREENLRRMVQEAGEASPNARPNTGTAAANAGPSANYTARLVALIRSNIVFTGAVNALATAEVEVRSGPSGTILSRRLIKSSGQSDWDDAVLRAVDRTSTLPRDTDGRVPPVLIITFRPRE